MSRIQDFSFNKSNYDRPTQKHVCGRSVFGSACQLGPGSNGECQSQFECIPNKKGDRWFCSRSQNNGGACESGPSPLGECSCRIPKCVPLPNKRQQRKKIVQWSSIFSLIFILLFLYLPSMPELVSPGQLSTSHQFLDNNCTSCHKTNNSDPFEWIQEISLSIHSTDNNKICEKCHKVGDFGSKAHTAEPKLLKTKNESISSKSFSCIFCHREHQGRQMGLANITDKLCQGCHKQEFANFHEAHAEFKDYPFTRRTNIIFDHNTHINDYFSRDAKQGWVTTDCSRCHSIDRNGFSQNTNKFEKICMDCHEDEVTAKRLEVKGIPILQIPALDLDSLKSAKLNIGEWPSELEDQEISPALLLFLASNPEIESIIQNLSTAEIDLTDLSDQPKDTLKQVALLAWSIKALFYKAEKYGEDWFQENLTLLYSDKPALSDAKLYAKTIPYELIGSARKSWFPKLSKEIKQRKNQKYRYLFSEADFPVIEHSDENNIFGNWSTDNFGISYQPAGHADPNIVKLFNLAMNKSTYELVDNFLYKQVSYTKAPGQCAKCHSLEVFEEQRVINWEPKSFNAKRNSLTYFSHRSHPSPRINKGCVYCHSIDTKSEYLESYKQMDPLKSSSNFTGISKEKCSNCHQKDKSGENCTMCHQYHMTESTIK